MLAPKAFMHQTRALTRLLCTKPTQFVQDSARSRAFESRFAQITGRRAARRAPALGDAAATAAVAAIFEAFFKPSLKPPETHALPIFLIILRASKELTASVGHFSEIFTRAHAP